MGFSCRFWSLMASCSSAVAPRLCEPIIDLATAQGLATIHGFPVAGRDGALVAFGPDYADIYRRAGGYVDQILKGEKPADLPVQEPVKFHMVVNLKTARALGFTMPAALIARADEVIE